MLAQGGQLTGEQVFTDVYWDAEGCGLTERDWWLRSRAGRWELKASTEVVSCTGVCVCVIVVLRGVQCSTDLGRLCREYCS